MGKRKPARRRPYTGLFRFMLAILLAGAGWVAYVQWIIHKTEEAVLPDLSDTAIVLGAALWNNAPSPALRERLEHAAALYGEGRFRHIIVSGGVGHPSSSISEAEGMRRYLAGRGIPEEAIHLEDQARNTLENLAFSQTIMENNGWESALIITHHYHGARALDIARFLGYSSPYVSTMDSKVMWMAWHKGRETLAYTKWTLQKWQLRLGHKAPARYFPASG